jgi:hypothetical protein
MVRPIGRLTGQWHLHPLPFDGLREFLPNWSADERVAAYAVVVGNHTRAGFTDAARAEAETVGAQLVDLGILDADLGIRVEQLRVWEDEK